MTIAATGPLNLPIENLRTLLAASASFQTWVAAADATEALTHIYCVAVPAPLPVKRPLALIRHPMPSGFQRVADGGGNVQHFLDTGALELAFSANIGSGNLGNDADAEFEFTNAIGSFVDEMSALASSDGYLNVTGIEVIAGPQRSHPAEADSEGHYYEISLRVKWGP